MQPTWYLMRYKVNEELAAQKNMFGNVLLKKSKLREGYGKDYEKFIRPIKLPNGQFEENYWHLQNTNFFYLDKGLHSDALEMLGQSAVNMGGNQPPHVGI